MRYILLIYSKENDWTGLSEKEKGEMFQQYMGFTESIRKSGHYVAGDGLEATATATTVRVRDGKTVSTDGPFAETREQLGGYYVDRGEGPRRGFRDRRAHSRGGDGSIEVRPIMEMP